MGDPGPASRVDASAAADVLDAAGVRVRGEVSVHVVPSGHTVCEVAAGDEVFFLKLPTKDLEGWAQPADGAAHKVKVEASAAACLSEHAVPAVEVIAAEVSTVNRLGWPYLLTRGVRGEAFTDVVAARRPGQWIEPLEAVGAFLASVHAITFPVAGPIVNPSGPDGSFAEGPSPLHSPEALQRAALADLAEGRPRVPPRLAAELEGLFSTLARSVAANYATPRFVISGFHPNHPFLDRERAGWRVGACIDMEGASAGSVIDDIVTFCVGVMRRFRPAFAWWEPLFRGYGQEPPFESIRLELLASCTYWCDDIEPLEAAYRRLLAADSWSTVFGLPSR